MKKPEELVEKLFLALAEKFRGTSEIKLSQSQKNAIEIKSLKQNSLSLHLLISDKDIVFTYFNDTYSNYSELPLGNSANIPTVLKEVLGLIDDYLNYDAIRTDRYVGDKLVASRLAIGQQVITSVKGFKLFGRRNKKSLTYEAPAK